MPGGLLDCLTGRPGGPATTAYQAGGSSSRDRCPWCQFALAIGPGLLYGHFTETPDNKISGIISGGTGALTHACGTIKGGGTVTVRYHLTGPDTSHR